MSHTHIRTGPAAKAHYFRYHNHGETYRLNNLPHSADDLKQMYALRFHGKSAYRKRVWHELCSFFSQWISPEATVLDLGCGHCEFINEVKCRKKFGMDLNPDAEHFAAPEVTIIQQDCSAAWAVPPGSLDVVFTSNFFEHLPTKTSLEQTLKQAYIALVPGGRLIALGPNVKHLPGSYWDFFDHYLPLTELALTEVLAKCGFSINLCHEQFLPYTMSDGKEYPMWLIRLYFSLPFIWRFFGKQFLVIAVKKPSA